MRYSNTNMAKQKIAKKTSIIPKQSFFPSGPRLQVAIDGQS